MAKLCPAGKAAAKKKFAVYPSAYANIWASKYCKGKVGRNKKSSGGLAQKGKKGKGIRKLKKVAPAVAKRMGYKKGKRV